MIRLIQAMPVSLGATADSGASAAPFGEPIHIIPASPPLASLLFADMPPHRIGGFFADTFARLQDLSPIYAERHHNGKIISMWFAFKTRCTRYRSHRIFLKPNVIQYSRRVA
jgi:hypothetical protein